jgi:hypothetical protein
MEVAGANRRRPLLLFFGSRESAVAQLSTLGHETVFGIYKLAWLAMIWAVSF